MGKGQMHRPKPDFRLMHSMAGTSRAINPVGYIVLTGGPDRQYTYELVQCRRVMNDHDTICVPDAEQGVNAKNSGSMPVVAGWPRSQRNH